MEGAEATIWTTRDYKDWIDAKKDLFNDYGANIRWEYRDYYTGYCGDHLTWEVTDKGELIIQGYGPMYDYCTREGYSPSIYPPWYECQDIKKIIISNGVTTVGNYAFYNCRSVDEISLGPDLELIGYDAFYLKGNCLLTIPASVKLIRTGGLRLYSDYGATSQITFLGDPPIVCDYALGEGSAVIVASLYSDSWQTLRDNCTDEWHKLKIAGWAQYYSDSAEWSLTDEGTLWITGHGGPIHCTWPQSIAAEVKEIHIGEGISEIENSTFKGCTNVERIYISSEVGLVAGNAFQGCNQNLSEIYVGVGSDMGRKPYYVNRNSYTTDTTYLYLYERTSGDQRIFEIPEDVDVVDYSMFENDLQVSHIRVPKDTILTSGNGLNRSSTYPVVECFDNSTAKQFCLDNNLPYEIISCGENAQWRLNNDSELIITGTGSIYRTWPDDVVQKVKTIRIGDGITQIEDGTFAGCSGMQTLHVASSVFQVADSAFSGCNQNLKNIYMTYGPTAEQYQEESYYVNQGSSRACLHLYERQDLTEYAYREFAIPYSAEMVDFNIFEGDGQISAVVVPKKLRYKRVAARPERPFNRAEIIERDRSEIENLEKGGPIAAADYYILNDGSVGEMHEKIEEILKEIEF